MLHACTAQHAQTGVRVCTCAPALCVRKYAQGVAELQRAYALAAHSPAPPQPPALYMLAFFHAPASLFSMADLPSAGQGKALEEGEGGNGGQATSRGRGGGSRRECTGVREHREAGLRGSQALLLATVDGRVRVYDWDDPGGCAPVHPALYV